MTELPREISEDDVTDVRRNEEDVRNNASILALSLEGKIRKDEIKIVVREYLKMHVREAVRVVVSRFDTSTIGGYTPAVEERFYEVDWNTTVKQLRDRIRTGVYIWVELTFDPWFSRSFATGSEAYLMTSIESKLDEDYQTEGYQFLGVGTEIDQKTNVLELLRSPSRFV